MDNGNKWFIDISRVDENADVWMSLYTASWHGCHFNKTFMIYWSSLHNPQSIFFFVSSLSTSFRPGHCKWDQLWLKWRWLPLFNETNSNLYWDPRLADGPPCPPRSRRAPSCPWSRSPPPRRWSRVWRRWCRGQSELIKFIFLFLVISQNGLVIAFNEKFNFIQIQWSVVDSDFPLMHLPRCGHWFIWNRLSSSLSNKFTGTD